MPMQRERYPADWEAISKCIRERAGNKCEWCGVVNGAVGARDFDNVWHDEDAIENMNSTDGYLLMGDFPKMIKIVLTVAHLGTAHADGTPGDKLNKRDVRPENLAALCQKCHLNHDRDEHMANAAATRARKRLAAKQATGQQELF